MLREFNEIISSLNLSILQDLPQYMFWPTHQAQKTTLITIIFPPFDGHSDFFKNYSWAATYWEASKSRNKLLVSGLTTAVLLEWNFFMRNDLALSLLYGEYRG